MPTSAANGPDPRALLAAGWSEQDLEWEGLQAEALAALAEDRAEEATENWAAALRLARAHFAPNDLRLATSIANQGAAAALRGETDFAASMFQEAETVWDSAGPWIDALKPAQRARSSTFHLRLESKHPGGYVHFEHERHKGLASEGRAFLAALKAGQTAEQNVAARLARWQKERPEGFTDGRKLLGAVLLIAG